MENSESAKNVKGAIKVLESGVKTSLVSTLFTNLILAGSVSLLWSFLNTLQMVLYLPLGTV
jgi:hypothetical protein